MSHAPDLEKLTRGLLRFSEQQGKKPGQNRGKKLRKHGKRTWSMRRASKAEMAFQKSITTPLGIPEHERPETRGECLTMAQPRPCPFVSCKYHLAVDVNTVNGNILMNRLDVEVFDIPATCSLDVADRGGATKGEVARILDLTKTAVTLIERKALLKLRTEALRRVAESVDPETGVPEPFARDEAMSFVQALDDVLGVAGGIRG